MLGVVVTVLVTVLVGTPVFVGVLVLPGRTDVLVRVAVAVLDGRIDAVITGVFVRVAVGTGLPTPLELPGKPHPTFEAPRFWPAAFTGIAWAQMSPPVPGRVALRPVVTVTPSVPKPYTM
jgi:hypothetical protein